MTEPVPRARLGADGYSISRLLIGGWQLSQGHREEELDERVLFAHLDRLVEAGRTTFDCADIYVGVEELFGRYLRRAPAPIEVHTKYVPDLDGLAGLRRADVERTIDRSLSRLGVERLDLVQFSWWDYAVPRYVEGAMWLDELREEGKIRHVALTNFDVPRTREILEAGVPIVANQVQGSLFDRRLENGMSDLAREHGFGLLTYGSLAGGFLTERWLGVPERDFRASNRSLTKYALVIDELGGWDVFQELLSLLARIAERHQVHIPAVALRWVLDRPAVVGAIVGTYPGLRPAEENPVPPGLQLDAEAHRSLDLFLHDHPGPPGDCFGMERDPDGPHSRIMWKNLHRTPRR